MATIKPPRPHPLREVRGVSEEGMDSPESRLIEFREFFSLGFEMTEVVMNSKKQNKTKTLCS